MTTRQRSKLQRTLRSYTRVLRPRVAWRSLKHLIDPESKFYGLYELDRKLLKYLDYPNGFFVELGANDGVSQSNTFYFERHKNWKGILVEPVPHNYLLCRANRSARNHVFCNACTSFQYKERFVEIAFANLMSCPIGLESDVENPLQFAESGKAFLAKTDSVFTFGAIAKPLNDLLVAAQAPRLIDLLSLDVEGAEIEVLKGVDHEQFRFKYACIETRAKDKLVAYAKANGYELVEQLTHHDYLFADARTASPR